MKKFKIVLTAIVMLLASTSFAMDPVKVSPAVKAAFSTDFTTAKNVNWKKTGEFYFASFTLNGVMADAAYNTQGELIGTSRRLALKQIPLSITLAIAERYAGYEVSSSVLELTFEGITRYYVSVENEAEWRELKCYSNGNLETERRTKKRK